jgi:DNA-binding CsgD family transcriptional regulator
MIHDLWEQLADFAPSHVDRTLTRVFEALGALVQADNVFWVVAMRVVDGSGAAFDHEQKWRLHTVEAWRPSAASATPARVSRSQPERPPEIPAGFITPAVTRGAGRFRVHQLHGGARGSAGKPGPGAAPAPLPDRLWVVFPVTEDMESYFVLDRTGAGARFSTSEAAFAASALRGIKWFHRQLLLSHGLVAARRPLTATERRVVRLLLTEQTEKEIARTLGLGFHTTHKHVSAIYRKFGVRSRTGLMALWLGGRG